MACFCFRPSPTSEVEPRAGHARGQKSASGRLDKAGSQHRGSEATSSKPHPPKATEEARADGAHQLVDRESPVSVFSGPGDDVSSDQRRPCELESGAKVAGQGTQQQQQQPRQLQQQQQKAKLPRQHSNDGGKQQQQQQEEQGMGAKGGPKLPPRTPEELLVIASHMMMDASGPRGYSEPHVLPGSMDFLQLRKSGELPLQLPGIRAPSPLPSQRLHLQRDREQALAGKQQQQHGQGQGQGQGQHQALDQLEKQHLKQQLLQQKGQAQRSATASAGAGAGSCYASALPGKPRILAWLDESDLAYATLQEADNAPSLIKMTPGLLSAGRFLSSLKLGSYEDLAGASVTRDVLVQRGMHRAELLPDSAEPSGAAPEEGRAPLREGHASSVPPLVGRPARPPVPSASTATFAGAGGGAASGATEGAVSGLQGKARGSGEASLGVPGSGREASPVMQGLLSQTAAMLRQRSLGAEDGSARLAGIAAGMYAAAGEAHEWDRRRAVGDTAREASADVSNGGGASGEPLAGPGVDRRNSEGAYEKGAGTLGPAPTSAPISPDHEMHAKGRVPSPLGWCPAVSSPAPGMSPALGLAGSSAGVGSRGRAPTADALSDLGADSTGESPGDSS